MEQFKLYLGGEPIQMSAPEICTLVAGKTYQIADETRRILRTPEYLPTWAYSGGYTWDEVKYISWYKLAPYIFVYDNGNLVSPENIRGINPLLGTVIFVDNYTVTGPVEIKAEYIPITKVAAFKEFSIVEKVDLKNTTTFKAVQNDSIPTKRKSATLHEITGSIKGSLDTTNQLDFTQYVYIEAIPQTGQKIIIKAKLESNSKSFTVESANEIEINWVAQGPIAEVI